MKSGSTKYFWILLINQLAIYRISLTQIFGLQKITSVIGFEYFEPQKMSSVIVCM